MARSTVEAWLKEEQGSSVIRVISNTSVIESQATSEPMTSYTKTIPRSGSVGVSFIPKGSAYPEDAGTVDEIVIQARKFGTIVRLAEEDINDQLVNILEEKKTAWGSAYATFIDNACLGVAAASNGTTVPFTSVYQAVSTADASVGYTAAANRIQTAATTAITFQNLLAQAALYEASPFFDQGRGLWIMHPSMKATLRGITDTTGRPLLSDGYTQESGTSILGYQLQFSTGAVASTVASATPTGNKLSLLGNRDLLRLGKLSGPESYVSDPKLGVAMQTDETLLKLRSRRAFVVGDVRGWTVLEQR